MAKLLKKEKLTVAYFGGSITQGAGASDYKYCWRSLTTEWFKRAYPESETVEIDASIGGTGSELGEFREDNDVLKYSPDLVFIEFATNDSAGDGHLRDEETLIRKIIKHDPETDIVLVKTITERMYERLKAGEKIESYDNYEKMKEYYSLPMLDLGAEFIARIERGEGDFLTYTKDRVHPNDYGYSIYFEAVKKFLVENLSYPAALTDEKYLNAHMLDARENGKTDFEKSNEVFRQMNGFIHASEKGKSVTLDFVGTTIGVMYRVGYDNGDFEWNIDGGEYTRVRCWDDYALTFNRVSYVICSDSLEYGEHTLNIRVLGEKDERSTGTNIVISSFLVG